MKCSQTLASQLHKETISALRKKTEKFSENVLSPRSKVQITKKKSGLDSSLVRSSHKSNKDLNSLLLNESNNELTVLSQEKRPLI